MQARAAELDYTIHNKAEKAHERRYLDRQRPAASLFEWEIQFKRPILKVCLCHITFDQVLTSPRCPSL